MTWSPSDLSSRRPSHQLGARAERALLIADVVESVRLAEQDEAGFLGRWLTIVQNVREGVLPPHRGRFVKSLGDGMLLDFDSPRDAVAAAFSIIREVDQSHGSCPPSDRIFLRLGIEAGSVIVEQDDVYGRSVNRVARLATLADPGEIVISADVRGALVADLDAEVEDLGECYLKHFPEPVRAYRLRPPDREPMSAPRPSSREIMPVLAVMPFEVVGAPDGRRVLGEVLSAEITRRFARSDELGVISRLSMMSFSGRQADPRDVGEILKADYVLNGTCRPQGRRTVIAFELLEPKSLRIVSADRVEVPTSSLLADRSDAAEAIVARVERAIVRREIQHVQAQALPNLKSHTLLIAGIALMHRMSPRSFEQARLCLEALADRLPRLATPQAWLAKWHVLRVQQGWSPDPREDAYRAQQRAMRALDTEPRNVLALTADGLVHTHHTKRLDLAEARYDAALAEAPNDALAWLLKGTLQAFKGEGAPAVDATQRALQLSPLDPHRYYYDSLAATAHLAAHAFEDALAAAQRSYRANRTHTSTLRAIAIAQWCLGQHENARGTVEELLGLEPSLTVERWRQRSPSAPYAIGREWADALGAAGVPP